MTDDRTLDRAARSWLEAGPTEAPDHAVEAALLEIRTTHQERDWHVPWRNRSMTPIRLAAAAIAVAIVAVGGILLLRPGGQTNVGGPSFQPTTAALSTPSPSLGPAATPAPLPTLIPVGALDLTHASDLYRYSVRYPTDWTLDAGTSPGLTDNVPTTSAKQADFYGNGLNHGLLITSGPLSAARNNLATWSAFVSSRVQSQFGTYLHIAACTQGSRTLVVDGEPANEVDFICPGATWLYVTAVHGGRQYQIAWLDDGGFEVDALRPLLDRFLDTFSFSG